MSINDVLTLVSLAVTIGMLVWIQRLGRYYAQLRQHDQDMDTSERHRQLIGK